jgi:serine/threonine protein phosphatase PrpC
MNVLILGCDGIWDVLKDSEAVEIVQRWEDDMTNAAVALRDAAYLRDSGDDLSVICIVLDQREDKRERVRKTVSFSDE